MDASTTQEAFGRAVMAGCLVVSAALALACLVLSTGWQDRQAGPDGGEKWRGVSDTSCQNGGMQFGGACQTPSAKTEGRVHEESPSVRPLTDADYAAGFALARIGTGETWDFAPPPGAEVSDDWMRFGAARDWFRSILELLPA